MTEKRQDIEEEIRILKKIKSKKYYGHEKPAFSFRYIDSQLKELEKSLLFVASSPTEIHG